MVPSIGFSFSFLCFFCGSIPYSLCTFLQSSLVCADVFIPTDCGHSMRNFCFYFFFSRLVICFCDDRHVSWNSKDHFIFIYGDLNNSYHNSAHFLKLHISSSFTEKKLKEKAERILSTPGWSVCF